MKKAICQQLKDYHVVHHFNRYIETLRNKEYMISRNMTNAQVADEIRHMWARRLELEQYDQIKNGKRVPKIVQYFSIDLD